MFSKKQPKAIETSTKENSSANLKRGMLFQDEQGYVRAINSTAADILGLSTEQIIGCNLTDLSWQTIDENGLPFKSEINPAMVTISTGKPCLNVVMGFYQPNGKLIWLLLDSQPLFQNNQASPYAVVTTFSDITELKQLHLETTSTQNNFIHAYLSEEELGIYFNDRSDCQKIEANLRQSEDKFRQLMENIDEAVFWIIELEKLEIIYVSPSYEKIWGSDRDLLYLSFVRVGQNFNFSLAETTQIR
jgi:PAS domain S-box-containing protein